MSDCLCFFVNTVCCPSLSLSLSYSPLLSFSFILNAIFAKGLNPFAQFRIFNRLPFLKVFFSLISYYFKFRNNGLFQLCKASNFLDYFLSFMLLNRLILSSAHLFCLMPCLTWQLTANTRYFFLVFPPLPP